MSTDWDQEASDIFDELEDYVPDYKGTETKSHSHTFVSGPHGCTICGMNPVNNVACLYPVLNVESQPEKENLLVKLKSEDIPDTLLEKKLVEAIKNKAKELEKLLEEEPAVIEPEEVVKEEE